jgi:hypothetical protein
MSLEDLALRISDGEALLWDNIERSLGGSDDLAVARNLRILARVASAVASEPAAPLSSEEALEATTGVARALAGGDSTPRDGTAPRSWGRFELRHPLGRGAYGEVWSAWDPKLEREVALKLLEATAGSEGAATALREGRLLARIRHANVVTVFDADENEGRVGIAMELVRGRTLRDLVREQGRLSARETLLVGIEVLKALSELHRSGLVHRDIKAGNVMREEGGRIVLMDFGTVVDLAELRKGAHTGLTGTPLWMAPELFLGAEATVRSDLYSVGVLLFHLATGDVPVDARTIADLEEKHRKRDVKLLRDLRPELPDPFLEAVERALAASPDARFATAGEMASALSRALGAEGRGPRRGPVVRGIALGLAAILAIAAAGWLLVRPPRESGGLAVETKVPAAPPPPAEHEAAYAVEASLYRIASDGKRERLAPGAKLVIGDRLTLSFRSSRSVHLYVINEDEAGNAYALFPLPDLATSNPLSAGALHELPGRERDGTRTRSWQVTSAGGREHLLLLASPTRLVEFEAEMSALARPLPGQAALHLSPTARMRLRGIGGLGDAPPPAASRSADRIFDLARELASQKETVTGVWLRQIVLENPADERR